MFGLTQHQVVVISNKDIKLNKNNNNFQKKKGMESIKNEWQKNRDLLKKNNKKFKN